ncbi:MAG: hypothetical protein MRJ67_11005 [Nitrospirales bacterium]|nr:hypothetical protein [Nitrospirales bacterium]
MKENGLAPGSQNKLKNEVEKQNWKDILAASRDGLFIASIFGLFTGWIYAYFLYKELGLFLNSLELPVFLFFIYSYNVFSHWACLLFLLGIIIAYLTLFQYLPHLTPLLFILTFFPLFWMAKNDAIKDALNARAGNAGLKYVQIKFNTNFISKLDANLILANEVEQFLFLMETEKSVMVLKQNPPKNGVLSTGWIYSISKDNIAFIKTTLN